jgi:hypothetical protein
VIVRRWQEFSGGTATLGGDGQSFEEIARASHGLEAATPALTG